LHVEPPPVVPEPAPRLTHAGRAVSFGDGGLSPYMTALQYGAIR
jgi:hypothetical protein